MIKILDRITYEMNEEEVLAVILDEIMARAEPDVAEAIRFCAIPHWFDEEILAWLRGEGREPSGRTREILAGLTELTFVGPYRDRGYAYHENVRNLLLHRWRQENAEGFQELSGAAAAYYADKLGIGKSWMGKIADRVKWALGREKAPTEEQRAEWQREAMYHLLVADEEQGFELFSSMFNRARQFYQLSTCELLLSLAKEQENDLSTDNQLWLRLYKGEMTYASALWDEALETWQGLEGEDLPEDLQGALANDLGLLYQDKGEWDKAIGYYQRSLAIWEKVGDEHWMSSTFNDLGEVYRVKEEWDKAIKYYQRSLAIDEKVGNEYGVSITFNNLGLVYHGEGEWDKAIDYFQRSLEITQRIGDEYMMGRTFNNLGMVYHAKGEWDEAIDYFQRDLAICEKVGDEVGAATTMYNMALLYEDMERYDEALELLERVVIIRERVGHPDLTRDRETLERIRKKAR